MDKITLIVLISILIAGPAGWYASAIDVTMYRAPGDTSNAWLIQNSYGVNQFWIDSDGYVYANGTQMRINSITCGGTDKISAYNNVTGLFTCTTDTGGAGSDSHTNLGTGEASIALESVGSNHQFKTLEFDGSFTVTNYTNRILVNFTGGGSSVTSDNIGVGDAAILIEQMAGNVDAKRLQAGYGITITNNTNEVLINNTSARPYQFLIYQDGSDTVALDGNGIEQYRNTDDDLVIQSAINSLDANNGGRIILKQGTYTIDSTITIPTQNFIFEGEYGTLITGNSSEVSPYIQNVDTTDRVRTIIKNIRFGTSSEGSGTAIDMHDILSSTIRDFQIAGFNKGIVFDDNVFYNTVQRGTIRVSGAGSVGITFDSVANFNNVYNTRVDCDANSTGIYVNSVGINLNTVDIEDGCAVALDVAATGSGFSAHGLWIEGNVIGVRLASGADIPSFFGGVIQLNTQNIVDNGADYPQWIGVRKESNKPFNEINNINITKTQIFDADFIDMSPAATALTINSGSVTITRGYHVLLPESGTSDTLDSTSTPQEGQILILRSSSSSNTITITDTTNGGAGQFELEGDFIMDNSRDTLTVISRGSTWVELTRSNNQ